MLIVNSKEQACQEDSHLEEVYLVAKEFASLLLHRYDFRGKEHSRTTLVGLKV